MSEKKENHFEIACALSADDGKGAARTQINLWIGHDFDFDDKSACGELLRRLRAARDLFRRD